MATSSNGESDYQSFGLAPQSPAAELIATGAQRGPLGFLEQAAAQSKIGWRPFSPAVLKEAEEKKLPILLLCCNPMLNSSSLFDELDKQGDLRKVLESNIIPAVVDVLNEPAYEIEANLSFLHSGENLVSYPMFIVLTPQGLPLLAKGIGEAVLESQTPMLTTMLESLVNDWEERANFYAIDSATMLRKRRERNISYFIEDTQKDDPPVEADIYQMIIKLENSQLNAVTLNGSNPVGLVNSLFAVYFNPDASPSLRQRARDLATSIGTKAANSYLWIPMIGAQADSAVSNSFKLPRFAFSIQTQARCIKMLVLLNQLGAAPHLGQRALKICDWIDKYLKLDEDHFAESYLLSSTPEHRSKQLLYSHESLKKVLSPDALNFLEREAKVSPKGNLPYGDQPAEVFSRLNSVTPIDSAQNSAQRLGMSLAEYLSQRSQIDTALATKFANNTDLTNTGVPSDEALIIRGQIDLFLLALDGNSSRLDSAIRRCNLACNKILPFLHEETDPSDEQFTPFPAASTLLNLAHLLTEIYQLTGKDSYLERALQIENFISKNCEETLFLMELPEDRQLLRLSSLSPLSLRRDDSMSSLAKLRKILSVLASKPELGEKSDLFLKRLAKRFVRSLQFGSSVQAIENDFNHRVNFPDTAEQFELQTLAKLMLRGILISHQNREGPITYHRAGSEKEKAITQKDLIKLLDAR